MIPFPFFSNTGLHRLIQFDSPLCISIIRDGGFTDYLVLGWFQPSISNKGRTEEAKSNQRNLEYKHGMARSHIRIEYTGVTSRRIRQAIRGITQI